MNYTGEKEAEKQGRLDRFLNLAYSGIAGIKSDEFGFKGLGSKLITYLENWKSKLRQNQAKAIR